MRFDSILCCLSVFLLMLFRIRTTRCTVVLFLNTMNTQKKPHNTHEHTHTCSIYLRLNSSKPVIYNIKMCVCVFSVWVCVYELNFGNENNKMVRYKVFIRNWECMRTYTYVIVLAAKRNLLRRRNEWKMKKISNLALAILSQGSCRTHRKKNRKFLFAYEYRRQDTTFFGVCERFMSWMISHSFFPI